MSELSHLAATLFRKAAGRDRIVVAVVGPPGAGKSTLAEALVPLLPEGEAAIVPMDGFHFDNAVLDQRSLRDRKGAPETFDAEGYGALLRRLREGGRDIAVPVFDRAADLSRAAARIVPANVRFVIAEGNYLLLDEEPWRALAPLFDITVSIAVERDELERRLVRRWLDHGHDEAAARERALGNDIPNALRVLAASRPADIVFHAP
jgi:pantothenate kinase